MKNAVARDKTKCVDRLFRAKVYEVVSHISMGVCEILMDGNCLFNAVCHQLHRLEIESEQHKAAMDKLRKDVVDHIEKNMPAYSFILKDRIYQTNPAMKPIVDLEKETKCFLEKLSKDKYWGGYESLHAISNIHKKNIIIINENDEPNMILEFTPDFNESIIIFMNSIRNHNESVVNIDSQVIIALSNEIIDKQTKSHISGNDIIEIEDD